MNLYEAVNSIQGAAEQHVSAAQERGEWLIEMCAAVKQHYDLIAEELDSPILARWLASMAAYSSDESAEAEQIVFAMGFVAGRKSKEERG